MTNFDPPSGPFYQALRRGEWGGRMIREECPECKGEPEPFCQLCDGTGYIWNVAPRRGLHGGRMVLEKCENCEGTGRLYKVLGRRIDITGHRYDICANCHGNGEIWVEDLPE